MELRELKALVAIADGAELLRLTAEPAKRYGVELTRVGLRDVILPRDVQRVLMLEVEAERDGQRGTRSVLVAAGETQEVAVEIPAQRGTPPARTGAPSTASSDPSRM